MSAVPASSPIPTPQNLLQMSRMRGDSLYDDPLSARPMISTPRSRFDSITDSGLGIRPRVDSDRRLDALADEARAVAELQAAVAQHAYHLPRSPTSGVNFATRRVRIDSSAADEAMHDSATDIQNTMRVPVLSSVTSVGDLATRRNLANASSARKDVTSRSVEFESTRSFLVFRFVLKCSCIHVGVLQLHLLRVSTILLPRLYPRIVNPPRNQ
jgi:hypothetical protein